MRPQGTAETLSPGQSLIAGAGRPRARLAGGPLRVCLDAALGNLPFPGEVHLKTEPLHLQFGERSIILKPEYDL